MKLMVFRSSLDCVFAASQYETVGGTLDLRDIHLKFQQSIPEFVRFWSRTSSATNYKKCTYRNSDNNKKRNWNERTSFPHVCRAHV